MFNYERKSGIDLEYKINKRITLKLENGITYIYINGIKFIQCMRLTIDIPKEDIHLYDEVDSIDEAAKLYSKHVYQNRIVTDPMAAPVHGLRHDITPEQEFWGHCSNIEAWVENDYDTRILMSNISFPLLRELAQNGDLLANRVFKEEIALRLESGYPSVVHYLLEQDFLRFFTPCEFKTIIETTKLVENLVLNQSLFMKFLIYSTKLFPNQIKHIILKLILLPNGENILMSFLAETSKNYYYGIDGKFFNSIIDDLKGMSNQISIEHRKPFKKAILKIEEYLSEEDEKMRNKSIKDFYKIIVLGDPAVGKTELLAKFSSQFEEKYLRTVGVSIKKWSIELKDYNATVNLMFWNIAGQPQFYMLHRPYFKDADGILLVFDLTRSNTFSNINNWYSSAVKYGLSGIPRILVGNNLHLKNERKIILPMGEHLSDKLNAPYYETSTLTGENIKEVFEKIAELVYLAPERNKTLKNEPISSKNNEKISNDNNRLEKPLDWKSKLILLKEIQPSSEGSATEKEGEIPIEIDEREKRALETVFRQFKGSNLGKSQSKLMSSLETRDLVVLTCKYKLQTVFFWFFGLLFLFLCITLLFGLVLFIFGGFGPSGGVTMVMIVLLFPLSFGTSIWLIRYALTLKHFFIVLHYRGIYYKKIGEPKFIAWGDIAWMLGYTKYFKGQPTKGRVVKIYLKSKNKVRFYSGDYIYKDKFFEFDDVFISYKFRRCPFYSRDHNSSEVSPIGSRGNPLGYF